ncbi:MAG: UDP-N-acetylmuramate--L-alanine ligase, partial [Gemmatimonadota bacterium]|nr:UDP-N-acetylmuramate--L-alanine ligase [Gemmatimonadota bacterium]
MSTGNVNAGSAAALIDTTDTRPVHFIGIAGAGMSGLAELFVRRGAVVQGTDSNIDGAPDLTLLGVTVSRPDASLVTHARGVVYSSAIPQNHPEMVAARERGIPIVRRAEALAQAVSGGVLVAIAGTHGKTTTTVMTTEALVAAGRNPTGVVGGRVGRWHGNLRAGGNDTFVVEADEYDRSFLALAPTVAVVLNVEADHLDIYADLTDIKAAFEKFITPARYVVRCADDAGAMSLHVGTDHEVIAYSATVPNETPAPASADTRVVARDIEFTAVGSNFRVSFDETDLGAVQLFVPGIHNIRNSLAALSAGLALGCDFGKMRDGLAQFHGVERRFQKLTDVRNAGSEAAGVAYANEMNIEIIDDYAHHPTEVAATIAAARAMYPTRRLIVAFQPHLYSRTNDLHREFAEALSKADDIYLCDIYGAREQPVAGVTSALIGDLIPKEKLLWRGSRDLLAAHLRRTMGPSPVIITMGAGDITRTGYELLTIFNAAGNTPSLSLLDSRGRE